MAKNLEITIKAITTKDDIINVKQLLGVIKGASVEAAKAVRKDMEKTTRTWKHKPVFVIKIAVGNGEAQATVYTDDAIYSYVTLGTKPHIIRPRKAKFLAFLTPFKAKTRVRFIGSSNGKRGNIPVYAKEVHHPGTEAREFHIVIAEKHQAGYSELMQRRINNAVVARS